MQGTLPCGDKNSRNAESAELRRIAHAILGKVNFAGVKPLAIKRVADLT